jgi:hypothetical protein
MPEITNEGEYIARSESRDERTTPATRTLDEESRDELVPGTE